MAYSAGPCPVCGDFGNLSILKEVRTDRLFFYCESCGCAWKEIPKPKTVDSIDPVEKFAPQGHVEASLEEIRAAGIPLAGESHVEKWKESEEASKLLDKGGMYELHGLVHTLWSKAVGAETYSKAEWKRLEELVGKAFRTILGPEADRVGYMKLIAPKEEPRR